MSRWFAVVPPGLEPVVARELSWLGVKGSTTTGGVAFEATIEEGAQLCTVLRTPARLLLRIATKDTRSLRALAQFVGGVDWERFLHPRAAINVVASCHRSRLYRRDIVAQKVETVLKSILRRRASTHRGRPPRLTQRILIRIDNDQATLSIDAGGELLHRRGWRTSSVRAPIRENLAAAMLIAAGWQGDEALLDPFCGSGTIPIEAALMAAQRMPWTARSFAWEEWPIMGGQRPRRERGSRVSVSIVGSDQDAPSIVACTENAERAGVSVDWRLQQVTDIVAPSPFGLIVTNPPYGRRLGQRIRGVYVRFGQTLQERFSGWRVAFLAPNERLAKAVHPNVQRLTTFPNGGIRVGLFIIEDL